MPRFIDQLKTALMIQAGIETEAQIPMPMQDDTPLLCLSDQGGEHMSVTEDLTVTLRASMTGHQPIVMASSQPNAEIYQDLSPTLTAASGGNNGDGSENLAVTHQLVRRLTPLECERLMGFPDGWTAIEKATDSARYRALGNSIVVPCVEFLMRGIAHLIGENR